MTDSTSSDNGRPTNQVAALEVRLHEMAAGAMAALEELRIITGVDEWDESDERTLTYNDAYEVLGDDGYHLTIAGISPDPYVRQDDVEEVLREFDKYAERDMDHELHALVMWARRKLNLKEPA